MTRYTVSPPMLIERATLEDLLGQNEKYAEHLSSLQQIRMSDDLVKWCEEKGIKEVSSEQIVIRPTEWKHECGFYLTTDWAYPVIVNDVWEDLKWDFYRAVEGEITFDTLKSKYKLTRI